MKNRILAAILLSFSAYMASAQTLDEILEKHFEANGNAKMAKVKTVKMSTIVQAQGMQMEQTMYMKRPNKIKTVIDMMGQQMEMVYDGESAYMKNPMMGQQGFAPIGGVQAENLMKRADMDGVLYNYSEKGTEVEYLGKETIDGKDMFKLGVVMSEFGDDKSYMYLDADSYLLVRQEAVSEFQGNKMNVVNIFSDYEDIDGISFFRKMTSLINGMEQMSMEITDLEYDVDIDDSMFNVK